MPSIDLKGIKEFLHKMYGLDFSDKRDKELINKLQKAATDFNMESAEDLAKWLPKAKLSEAQTLTLASSLTVGETYFFRDKNALDYLEHVFLPKLILKRKSEKRIKIWSAGCATGEEAYSIAIMLNRLIPERKNWDIRILATDINPDFLERARNGIFSGWSFRKTAPAFCQNYFTALDKRNFQIKPEFRKMVSFLPLNLVTHVYPSPINDIQDMDVILCRNVMIYFTPDKIREVSNRLVRTMNSEGVLLVSPVETALISSSKLKRIIYKGNTIFHPKSSQEEIVPLQLPGLPKHLNSYKESKKYIKKVKPVSTTIPHSTIKRTERNTISQISSPDDTTRESAHEEIHTLYSRGKLEEAENVLESISGHSRSLLLLHAKIFADTLRFKKAKAKCKEVIQQNKTELQAYYLLATIYWEEGNLTESKQAFETILFLNPDYVMAHVFMANIYQKLSDLQNGLKHLRVAEEILCTHYDSNDILSESDGMSAEDMKAYIDQIRQGMTVDVNVS